MELEEKIKVLHDKIIKEVSSLNFYRHQLAVSSIYEMSFNSSICEEIQSRLVVLREEMGGLRRSLNDEKQKEEIAVVISEPLIITELKEEPISEPETIPIVEPDKIATLEPNQKTKEFIISTKLFSLCHSNKMGWFRLFGYGFTFKNLKIHNLTFSQRNKRSKYLKIGDCIFCYLPKNKIN